MVALNPTASPKEMKQASGKWRARRFLGRQRQGRQGAVKRKAAGILRGASRQEKWS